jgi:type I restriction enzyme M protein
LHPELTEQAVEYDAFSDIAFNPKKSFNCQARSVAVYVSLFRQGLLQEALKDKESFLSIVYDGYKKQDYQKMEQMTLWD